jgi:phosphate transport system permease protein
MSPHGSLLAKRRSLGFRKGVNRLSVFISVACSVVGVVFLTWILLTVFKHGFSSLSLSFFIEPTKPYGIPDGGIANAILGTIMITLGAAALGVPLGLLGGIYLSEFARSSKLGNVIRFSANVMMGIPSIIVGLFVYTLLVMNSKSFSGLSGSVALAIIMFPVALRTTEDMLCMVPNALRESALAIGAPRWRATVSIIFRAAKTGLITGVLLSIARVSGETAPLLFTALTSDAWPWRFLSEPTANLTVTITEYATNSPFDVMHARAWGAALLITMAVLSLNIICRVLFREAKR